MDGNPILTLISLLLLAVVTTVMVVQRVHKIKHMKACRLVEDYENGNYIEGKVTDREIIYPNSSFIDTDKKFYVVIDGHTRLEVPSQEQYVYLIEGQSYIIFTRRDYEKSATTKEILHINGFNNFDVTTINKKDYVKTFE